MPLMMNSRTTKKNSTTKKLGRYERLCPNPEKKKKKLPSYWDKLNKKDKVRWIKENMLNEHEYMEGDTRLD